MYRMWYACVDRCIVFVNALTIVIVKVKFVSIYLSLYSHRPMEMKEPKETDRLTVGDLNKKTDEVCYFLVITPVC